MLPVLNWQRAVSVCRRTSPCEPAIGWLQLIQAIVLGASEYAARHQARTHPPAAGPGPGVRRRCFIIDKREFSLVEGKGCQRAAEAQRHRRLADVSLAKSVDVQVGSRRLLCMSDSQASGGQKLMFGTAPCSNLPQLRTAKPHLICPCRESVQEGCAEAADVRVEA
ncbi:hypothetical protein K469DRAFT_754705 [Zopfia rhizophila CBS 207.26]|uniref:Uncharacterized protein n=1 Tax=Zopfia rhizophila CBS 207.26 TaxID=1314779 RepID=A0A6A6DKJ4_9PEZI|nr:hypothetical protein K469DRAFT_754705 [Zopfia rhizophila CBS 207.26]